MYKNISSARIDFVSRRSYNFVCVYYSILRRCSVLYKLLRCCRSFYFLDVENIETKFFVRLL